jgi:magnesium transporter
MAALVPSSTILKRLLIGRYLTMHEDDKELIEDLLLSNEQSIEGCKSNIKTIVSIREAYSTIATNNLNQIIRVLTSITVVLTIPTIIGTIYGMNVVLPLGTNPGAVWLLLGFMLITSALLLVFFRYKKWL